MIYSREGLTSKFIDNLFLFSFCLVFGSGIGITIGLIVSMNKVDDKLQKLQSERDKFEMDAARYKMKSEEQCSCIEGKTPVKNVRFKESML